ncbi:hypothetical protein TNCV_1749631 [Trichonephila clavipes]|nr:hypothetical protein TNCV_1749631 [Trichonephila clavipes]
MEKAAESASLAAAQKQKAYGDYFNKRSSVKNFSIGEQVVLLIPDSTKVGTHRIRLKPNIERKKPFVYRIPESLKIKVDEQIEELVRLDLIEESDAEIAYPIVCVNKKDGTLRLCVDFRALNSESVSDDFPMEDAVELIHSIGRANIITTLDLLKGYWAIPMAEDSKNLTSFKTHRQQYCFKYIPKYSELVYPLTELTKKRVPDSIPWTEKHDSSFPSSKKGFSGSTSLYSPVPDKPYTIHSDASQIGIAACLSQKCGDKCYPIAYASQN